MRSTIIFIIILGVAVFTGIGFLFYGERISDTNKQATKPILNKIVYDKSERVGADAQIAQLNKEVEDLKNKVENLAQAFQLAQGSNQLQHNSSVDPMTDQQVEDEEYFSAEQDRSDQHQVELEKRFATETTDLAWVDSMETQFQSSLNRLPDFGLKNTKMVYHECRATLCSAEFAHGREENPQFLSTALTMSGIEKITVVSALSDDGSPISKAYFFREGFTSNDVAE